MSKAAGGTHPTSSPSLRSNLGIPNLDFWTSVLVQSVVKPSKNLNFKQQKHLKSRATVHRHGQIPASPFLFFSAMITPTFGPAARAICRLLGEVQVAHPQWCSTVVSHHRKHHHFVHHEKLAIWAIPHFQTKPFTTEKGIPPGGSLWQWHLVRGLLGGRNKGWSPKDAF